MRRVRWVFVIVALGAGVAFWYFRGRGPNPGQSSPAMAAQEGAGAAAGRPGRFGNNPGGFGGPNAPVPVVAGTVQKKDVPIYLNGIGTVQAYNSVTVHPQVSGILVKVDFTEGQDVKKGDLLAEIDPRTYQAQVDQAVAKRDQDIAQLNNAKSVLDRDTDLFKKGVLDHQTYDTQRFLVDQLAATIKADQAAIDNAQVLLDYTRITAPFDGRIGLRQVDEGNYLTPGSNLALISQLKPISVVFTLPQQNVTDVNQAFAHGALKVIAMDSLNTKPLADGTLSVVDNQIDPSTGTVKLKATFENPDLQLWPGQFVNARLLVSTVQDGLVVPSSVVQRGPNGTYAYVITPEKTAEMRPIKVGQVDGDEALILGGLGAGEQVVVDGQYKLQPGGKVDVISPRSPAAHALAQTDQNATETPAQPGESPVLGQGDGSTIGQGGVNGRTRNSNFSRSEQRTSGASEHLGSPGLTPRSSTKSSRNPSGPSENEGGNQARPQQAGS
jgi:membrane fusion protein, multidrug efflux system